MNNWQKLDSPRFPVAIVLVAYTIFIYFQLSRSHNNLSSFVNAGDIFVNSALAPRSLQVNPNSAGYDGQFYYRLALAPFTRERTSFGITLDNPVYRQYRIVYPVLAWLLSFGKPDLVPKSLVIINILALCAIAWIGASYAKYFQRHAIWGLPFAMYAGFLLTINRDTVEIVEICFILGSIISLRQNRQLLAIFFLVLAVLTKETALIVAFGLLIALLISNKKTNFRILFLPAVASILAYTIWRIWLNQIWKHSSIDDLANTRNNIGIPLVGLVRFIKSILPISGHLELVWLLELIFIAVFMMVVVWVFNKSKANNYIKWSWLLYLTLIISLTKAIWVEDWAFLRALSEFYIFGYLILIESDSKIRNWILSGSLLTWLLICIVVVNKINN